MPEIFRVPLTAGHLALHADDDSDTGLSLELHNGEEGVMAPVDTNEMCALLVRLDHYGPTMEAVHQHAKTQPDTAA
jgi:hypothetical protein